jgi:hypothetical protein
MSNARCLTEGIDVPTVDMVAFPTLITARHQSALVDSPFATSLSWWSTGPQPR